MPGGVISAALIGGYKAADVAGPGLSFVDLTSTAYGIRTNTVTPAPAGIANDDILLLVQLTGDGSNPPPAATPPTGFIEIGTEFVSAPPNHDGFNMRVRTFYKRAASESGDYTSTHVSTTSQSLMVAYRGVDWATGPFDATETSNSGNGVTRTWTGLTTVTANTMLVALAYDWGDSTNDLAPPSGMTERLDTLLLYAADELVAGVGATGNRVHANNARSVSPWGARLIALRPA